MLEYLSGFLTVLKEVKTFQKYLNEKKDKTFEAIEAIHRAANQTRAYFNSYDYKEGIPNIELSELWLDAASAVRRLDADLYNRLIEKANFWSNPSNWNSSDVEEARIYIDDIISDTNRMIQKN